MRVPIVAGNWKMNKTASEASLLISELIELLPQVEGVDKVVCPPFTALSTAAFLLADEDIQVGAQNLHWEPKGAYTGEVAPEMVAEFCEYVIIGHSERRGYFGETDETVNKKIAAALEVGLTPIICVGETLEENQGGKTAQVVSGQVRAALAGFEAATVALMVIAYEPIWAIGTGLAAEPEGANKIIKDHIRNTIAEVFGTETAEQVRIQYGGSVKPGNARDYFSQPDIDGALVGGASLKAQDFFGIVAAAAQS